MKLNKTPLLHLLLGGLTILVVFGCSDEQETYTVGKSDIVESVYSSVTIEPEELYTVNASNSGYIDALEVERGDDIEAGQVIFSVRDIQSDKTASNARLNYEMAKSNYSGDFNLIEDLKIELEDARMRRANDSITYARNKLLFKKELISNTEMEQSELVYNASKNRYQLVKNKITRSQSDLKTSLSQARNTYLSSLSRSEDAMVRNRVDGMVYDLFKETGEFVSMQEPVALIGSKDDFVIKMRIDEVDITKVKIGQRILVSLEAYKGQVFEATITRISPKMEAQTQTFEIEGKFRKAPEELFMGLTGEGSIIILERKNALIIPLEYLGPDNSVLTENGSVQVTPGTRSLSHVEILHGLKEGDKILKPE